MEGREKEKGLTLVEVIITVVIFGIAFMAILLGLRQGLLIRGESYERMIAGNLARQQLELLKQYANTNTGRDPKVWNTTVSPSPTYKGISYDVRTRLIPISGSPQGSFARDPNMVPVRATVTWYSRGKNNTLVLETCYAIPIIYNRATPTPTPTPIGP